MKKVSALFSIVLLFVLIGCSGKGHNSDKMDDANTMSKTETSKSGMKSDNMKADNMHKATGKVHVYGIDQQKFVVDHKGKNLVTGKTVKVKGKTYYMLEGIKVHAGRKLTVKLTNISDLPASAMSHNWCLLKKGTDAAKFAQAGATHKKDGYIDPQMKKDVIKETGLVAPGNAKMISFEVPEKKGNYEYICTFPGHYSNGMKGKLMVQ